MTLVTPAYCKRCGMVAGHFHSNGQFSSRPRCCCMEARMEEGVTEDRPPPSVQREVTDRDPDEPFVETAAEQASRLLRVTEILARLLDAADSTIARYQALESKLNARIAELAGMEEAVELAMSQRAEAERKLRAVVQAAIDAGWDLPPVPR